jgi:Tfp pilus assembly protein PilP
MKHILLCLISVGLAWAQSPQIIQNTRSMMQTVERNQTNASNEALQSAQQPVTGTPKAAMHAGSMPIQSAATKATAKAVKPVAGQPKTKVAGEKHAIVAKPVKVAVAPKKQGQVTAPKKAQASASKKTVRVAPSPASADSSATDEAKGDDPSAPENKKWSMTGKRDPFISPVVSHSGGSGCATGKKCLEIGDINLRGIVHAEAGFIAVVTNSLNKAYFLRENDPVFNGYVTRITGDSITFKEMMQDRLGKPFTRDVVKKIVTPAV